MIPAAIPFFELHVLNLQIPGIGALPIDPWATLVMIGFVVALEMGRARAIRLGLDVRDFVDGTVFTVVSGFVFAHIYTVLFYFPERLASDGIWSLLRIWQGFASTGGLIGAIIGGNVFFRGLRPGPPGRLGRYFDVIAWCFPFGWLFGRMGCASVHDHIGKKTDFFLAMRFPPGHYAAGVRHELGMYEMLYMIPVCAIFLYLGRKDRPPGYFVGWFVALYCPIRFVLDFLRNDDLSFQDARYYGLTPAQYGMVALFVGAMLYLRFRDNRGFVPVPLGRQRLLAEAPQQPAPEEP
jgi:phosphatidylglycerol:prolipoprotein diacylglycerol transferase